MSSRKNSAAQELGGCSSSLRGVVASFSQVLARYSAHKFVCCTDYSCGCMDYGFRRPKENWEASDGAVYLLRELAQVGSMTNWTIITARSHGLCCSRVISDCTLIGTRA